MRISKVQWFGQYPAVGIAQVKEGNNANYYIGSVHTAIPNDNDIQYITEFGTPFPKEAGDALFGTKRDNVLVPTSKEQAELMVRLGSFYLSSRKNEPA